MAVIDNKTKQPGQLVKYRGRKCVVLPSGDPDLILVKPLGGSDSEISAIYVPLGLPYDQIERDEFEYPTETDLDSFESAKLLYNATKLSFRHASGPFRCMGKLSFRPRSYQLVPLIMSLKLPVTRLLIADDVGIGKTVESLLIAKEMLERGDIKRFAIICLPHLCDQWQSELRDKLGIEAEILRSSTVSSLERKKIGDDSVNVFNYFPFLVISIDYLKSEKRKTIFLHKDQGISNCPELVIVDEAHACAKPAGAKSPAQQQRFHLLHDIAKDENRHIILLTATPHSGKDDEFRSILGLLKPEFSKVDLENISKSEKQKLAKHFIQRKRDHIEKWLDEDTPFPKRDAKELPYQLSEDYKTFYRAILNFAKGLGSQGSEKPQSRMKFWAALALLRGVMSSPSAGKEMLINRQKKDVTENENAEIIEGEINPVLDLTEGDTDVTPSDLMERAELSEADLKSLASLRNKIDVLFGAKNDNKLAKTIEIISAWIKQGFQPIIFCRYIASADYVASQLREHFKKENIDVRSITSDLPDEDRKARIEEMTKSEKRILVATDCLSEGVNLQHGFNAVLHYDLPWNPNRIEQREGRVDRFGQKAKEIKTVVLWGEDNPIDVVVLKVLINKIRSIQKQTGVSISLGDENKSIMDVVLKAVLLNPEEHLNKFGKQLTLELPATEEVDEIEKQFTNELELAKLKGKNLRDIFAHESIQPTDVETDLKEVDEAIGNIKTLEYFIRQAIIHLGGSFEPFEKGYQFRPMNMEKYLVEPLGIKDRYLISFDSPTPEGYRYIGRNHQFVEQICHKVVASAFEKNEKHHVARASVFQTDSVKTKTTLIQFRVRNVIKEAGKDNEIVTEEMYLWGYEHTDEGMTVLPYETTKMLLHESLPKDISRERQFDEFKKELGYFEELKNEFHSLALERANHLVEAHSKFGKYLGSKRYEAVTPVLPPDVLGLYVLIPIPKASFN